MLKFLFCFLLRLFSTTADFEAINNMGLTTYQEERVWISDFESQFLLFIFIDPNCPITQKYIPKINSLTEKYDLLVYGVQPNLGIYYDEVMKFKDDYDFKFPVINDGIQKLTYC